MRVFVTGATGFIGSAIVRTLTETGHQVLGLARNDQAADALAKVGVEAHRGELGDPAGLAAAAKACDGVIHTAFVHDFSQFVANIETDRRAVEAMTAALEGSGKPMVIASGTLMVAHVRPATEKTGPVDPNGGRAASETLVMAASQRGVRGAVVRLPPPVHDHSRAGLLSMMVPAAREKGVAAYIGGGANLWPSVHRLDAAHLFCLALEKAEPGSALHAVAEEGIPMRAIAEAIGEGLGIPARSIAIEDAPAYLGLMGGFFAQDNLTTSVVTRQMLGWQPREIGLLDDLRQGVATWERVY